MILSACSFSFSNPEGTSRWNNADTGHDYRFKHNLPKVLNERKHAEEASHMGSDVYNQINDLEKPDVFGDAK